MSYWRRSLFTKFTELLGGAAASIAPRFRWAGLVLLPLMRLFCIASNFLDSYHRIKEKEARKSKEKKRAQDFKGNFFKYSIYFLRNLEQIKDLSRFLTWALSEFAHLVTPKCTLEQESPRAKGAAAPLILSFLICQALFIDWHILIDWLIDWHILLLSL